MASIWTYRLHDGKTMKSEGDDGIGDRTVLLLIAPDGEETLHYETSEIERIRVVCGELNRSKGL